MGSKRVGLARTQALIQSLKRELNLSATTLKGKDMGEKVTMFKSKVSEMSWDPRARAEASACVG